MEDCQLSSSKLPSMEDPIESSNGEVEAVNEQFYEEIEAPKFVDFTAPHHYCPDDRYWFCLRVGCDQKHEEEMDSETIYKNFVLRVMAARSPNIRLRKALDRNASRSPSKCPLSAPPKPSRPKLSNMAIISSISKKTDDSQKGVVRSLLRPKPTTPMLKTKPVAAKYLTTPRNRATVANQSSFRSVQNSKPGAVEMPKSRAVAKALLFRSPRKTIKVKTSVELRTPISKLCEGMKRLDISSQRKRALGYSSKPHTKLRSRTDQGEPNGSLLPSQLSTNQEAKSGRSAKGKVKGKLEKPKKLLGDSSTNGSKKKESKNSKRLCEKVVEQVATSTKDSELAVTDVVKREGNENLGFQTEGQEINVNGENGKGNSECCGELANSNSHEEQKNENKFVDWDDKENAAEDTTNSSDLQKHEHKFMDGEDKEHSAASIENSMNNKNTTPNVKKSFPMHAKHLQVKEEIAESKKKNLKAVTIASSPVCKLKKPKPTSLKPFRLRTDERGILKEANLERRTDIPIPQNGTSHSNAPNTKLQQSERRGSIQKKKVNADQNLVAKGRLQKSEATHATQEDNKHKEAKPMSSPLERLEKFRKMKSPIQKYLIRPQGSPSAKKEMNSFLIPGQKLDVIHEVSPEVWKAVKPSGNNPPVDDSSSRSSSCGKRSVTVGREPNFFHSKHAPKSCTKCSR
ncbi:uncharacterized protein LOC127254782 [Andrographis paniculata]|uniref:uncharacterized protein LOC127254782 n=1 Tax=Andrographis paniculata TaxID=175694 RepID=UPI0021E72F71|nr:uncharacterized protein LOC127254782 [Andrographis paniculata]